MSSKDWTDKDYYKVLGLSKDARPEQIRKAFRKIARENHPDQHPGDRRAEQRFKEASEAHDVLSDPDKRREYDETRNLFGGGFRFPRGTSQQHVSGEEVFRTMGDAGFGDIFGGLFGQAGAQTRRRSRKGPDLHGDVTIGFTEAIEGTTVGVQTAGDTACPACRGTGAKAGTSPRVCPTCQGSGVQQATSGGVFQMAEPCRDCQGRGLVVDDPCQQCHGTGKARSRHTMQVRIAAGVNDGQKIRVKGKGGSGENGGPAGDLYVTVHVRPHPVFGRSGENLTVNLPVTFTEATLGAEVEVPVMGGGQVKLRIPAGTPNGRVFRVRGRGVSKPGGAPGDLLVTVDVQVPDRLNESARQALRSYATVANEPNPRVSLLAGGR